MTTVTDAIRPADLVLSSKFDRVLVVQWLPVCVMGSGVRSEFTTVRLGDAIHVLRVAGITDAERMAVLDRLAARSRRPAGYSWLYAAVMSPGRQQAMVDSVRDCFRDRDCFDGCAVPLDVVSLVHSGQIHVVNFSLNHMLYKQA